VIVHFVRHGQTGHNRDGLGLGRADVPLTELGRRQAAAVAARLSNEPLERIFTSPLARCLATATAIAGERGIPVEVREDLIELDVGDTEGMTFPAMRERYPEFLEQWAGSDGHLHAMPGGESLGDVDRRLAGLLDELRDNQDLETVAVVSHNFVIKLAIVRLLSLEIPAFRSIGIDVASVSTVRLGKGGSAYVRTLNDRCYLHDLES
jgi:broad specificity phosphatase PhoE